jgi:hypothetical protein
LKASTTFTAWSPNTTTHCAMYQVWTWYLSRGYTSPCKGIGFIDEVSDTDRDAIIDAASRRLAKIPAPTLTFHHVTIRPEAITLYPNPTEPVRTIRSEIREAIAGVWGTNQVPEIADNYQPHLSIAYVNSHAESSRVAEVMSAKSPDPARLVLTSASCIAIQRVNHSYHWDTHATAHLAG